VRILCGGASDIGRLRSNNEDCYRVVESLQLFIVSDGMGGEAHGEVASALAVETIVKHCMDGESNPATSLYGNPQPKLSDRTRRLASAVHLANRKIFQAAEEHPEQHGMGATLTSAWMEDGKLSIAHVGDSRAYLLRSGTLQQLTNDHSLVAEQVRRGILTAAEADQSEMQSVLLRALGTHEDVDVDAEEHPLFPGDILLLCSDGLTRMLTEPEIAGTLQVETNPQKAADKLVELANDNGGADNITVIVVRLEKESKGWLSWLRPGQRTQAGKNGSAEGR
jgi:serine/threonine protein phosphatase PrpC